MNVDNINLWKVTIQNVTNTNISTTYQSDYLNTTAIDVSNLLRGVYGIRATDDKGKVYNTKFLK